MTAITPKPAAQRAPPCGPDGHAPQVVFTVNGPGEVSAWLYPITHELRRRHPRIRIAVCLLPCVFSSGTEAPVVRALGTADAVADVRQSYGLIWRNRLPEGFTRGAPTLVFHLGGEVALTLAIARRLRAPLYAYAEGPVGFGWAFRKVFYSGLNALPERLTRDRTALVGDLMVDAADLRRAATPGRGRGQTLGQTLGLFPGSRDYMAAFLLPYYAVTVDRLAARHPDLRFVMAKADFVPDAFLRTFPDPPAKRDWPAHRVSFHEDATDRWFETERGARIDVLSNRDVLGVADVALTIPGTNTGEIAASGIPMVTVVPIYLGDQVPLPGLPGHMGRIPLAGPALKRFFGHMVLRRMSHLALPNRRAGRRIVPEIVGTGLHDRIDAALEEILAGDPAALGAEVRAAMGPPGAAVRLADEIAAHFAT